MGMVRRAASVVYPAAVVLLIAVLGAMLMLALQGVRGVCTQEDSPSCVWVSTVQGNGRGEVIVVVNGPDGGDR